MTFSKVKWPPTGESKGHDLNHLVQDSSSFLAVVNPSKALDEFCGCFEGAHTRNAPRNNSRPYLGVLRDHDDKINPSFQMTLICLVGDYFTDFTSRGKSPICFFFGGGHCFQASWRVANPSLRFLRRFFNSRNLYWWPVISDRHGITRGFHKIGVS